MKRPPYLKELARKYKADLKSFEELAIKFQIPLSDGQNSIIQKNDELKLLKAIGVFNNSEKNNDIIKETEQVNIPLIFLEDLISKAPPVFRNDVSHKIFLHSEIINGFSVPIKKRITLILSQLAAHGKPSSIIKGTPHV